ncbi:MAG: hypothetical protein K5867_03695 [Bacteroidales bacterium]|nr:hypothetical protein [Bacteroidales bacterium]
MDDTLNINNQQEGSGEKRWHFDVSGVDVPKRPEEIGEADAKEEPKACEKEDEAVEEKEEVQASRKGEKRSIRELLRNNKITRRGLRRYVPWLFMVVMCFAVLIFNRYRLEDLVKEKNDTEERIKYLREHRIQMQKIYQESTKISKIAEELDTLGIGLLSGPPYEMK